MSLIWSGAGILVPVIVVIGGGSGLMLFGEMGAFLGIIASGLGIWFAGRRMNDKPDRILVDPETGEGVRLRRRNAHSLFFVPIQWWGAAVVVWGLMLVLVEAFVTRPEMELRRENCSQTILAEERQERRSDTLDGNCSTEHYSDGVYAMYYEFTLDQAETVAIEMTSVDVDSWLALRSGSFPGSAEPLEEDDDDGMELLDARIERVLAAGSYTIEATTLNTGETGDFTLTVTVGGDGEVP